MVSCQPICTDIINESFKKQIILADVNIPYKFSLDRNRNLLFFCINSDEFSQESFHSVMLDLRSGMTNIVPSICNGFASAVDQTTGTVYMGGSDGIYEFNYLTKDVNKPAIIQGIDIFDMYFQNNLYFIDTAKQNLYVYKDHKTDIIKKLRDFQIHHFSVDFHDNILFVDSTGLYILRKGEKTASLYDSRNINYRGATVDCFGNPYFIAQDGVYMMNENSGLIKILMLDNGFGLAFDKDNNIVYGDERTVNKLIRCEKHVSHL